MNDHNKYIRFTKVIVVVVFGVILAGSIVRTTQSGMGCPDWPKCFGNLIPPTRAEQVAFQPNHIYHQGQFIIYNDSLKYAKQEFVSGNMFTPADWIQYEKHNYAKFEVYQTWIEYVNRLLTGVLGILLLLHLIWSFKNFYKKHRTIFWLSLLMIGITGFEAWLGKTVVDSNLAVIKITAHMFSSLVLVAIPVLIISKLNTEAKVQNSQLKWLTIITLFLLVIQILFGTETRQQIDDIAKSLNYAQRELWIDRLDMAFKIHRSFSWVVAIFCFIILLKTTKKEKSQLNRYALWIIIVVLGLIILGSVMAFWNIPAFIQPLHLLLSSILVIALFSFRLRLK